MRDLARLIIWMVADLFRSRTALEVEIWMLRQQINVLRRTAPKKQTFSAIDRLDFVCLYRLRPSVRDALAIVKPETVVKWHRAGFRLYWRWKSKSAGWQANSSVGDTQAYPRDEDCQSAVGSASDPWRTPQPQNGSQIRSRKHAVGNMLPAISFVTGTAPMVRFL